MASVTLKSSLGGTFTLSVTGSGGNGTVSATATLACETGSFAQSNSTYLVLNIDGNEVARLKVTELMSGSTSVSGSRNVEGKVTIEAVWEAPSSVTSAPYAGSVHEDVNAGSSYTSGSISIDKASASIDESLKITLSNGNNNSITSLKWNCNGQSGSLSATSQTWNLSSLESVLNNVTSATCTLTATQSKGGNLSKSFTVTVPERYKPTITFKNVVGYNLQNNYLIAGTSYFDINYETGLTPSNNTAYISSIEVIGSYNPSEVGTPTFTKGTNKVTSNVLPVYSNASTYKISATLKVTDSRGRYATVQVTESMIGTVYNYIPPSISGFTVYRCDSSGEPKPSGMYGYAEVNVSSTTNLTMLKITVNDVDYNLSYVSDNKYKVVFGNNTLAIGTQYKVILSVQNTMMQSYGDIIQQVALLPTMQMPISLFDDGSQVSVSLGEMAFRYNDVGNAKSVLNLAMDSVIRATNTNGISAIVNSYDAIRNINNMKSNIDNAIATLELFTLGGLSFKAITSDEYSALTNYDSNTIYFVYEG